MTSRRIPRRIGTRDRDALLPLEQGCHISEKDKGESAIEFGTGREGLFVWGWAEVGTAIVSLIVPFPGGLAVGLATEMPGWIVITSTMVLWSVVDFMVFRWLRQPHDLQMAELRLPHQLKVIELGQQHRIRMAELRQPHKERWRRLRWSSRRLIVCDRVAEALRTKGSVLHANLEGNYGI